MHYAIIHSCSYTFLKINILFFYLFFKAIKNEMEERGTSMTDGSPLVNIREVLQYSWGQLIRNLQNMLV